jgi:hypothetical protein
MNRCLSLLTSMNKCLCVCVCVCHHFIVKMFSILISIFLVCSYIDGKTYRPVVLMHGVTATSADMDELAGWLRESFEGIYVVSIEIGNGFDDSFLLPMNRQVELFCQTVEADIKLQDGFNMIRVSQGSLIVRQQLKYVHYQFII